MTSTPPSPVEDPASVEQPVPVQGPRTSPTAATRSFPWTDVLTTVAAFVLAFIVGALLMIFGFALLAPTLVRPLSGLIGRPLARFQGRLGALDVQLAREGL